MRRYSQRSADYSTDGDRQYYDDRRYDHSRSALAPLLSPQAAGSRERRFGTARARTSRMAGAMRRMICGRMICGRTTRRAKGTATAPSPTPAPATAPRHRHAAAARGYGELSLLNLPSSFARNQLTGGSDLLRSRRSMMTTAMGTAVSTSGRRVAAAPPGRRTSSSSARPPRTVRPSSIPVSHILSRLARILLSRHCVAEEGSTCTEQQTLSPGTPAPLPGSMTERVSECLCACVQQLRPRP